MALKTCSHCKVTYDIATTDHKCLGYPSNQTHTETGMPIVQCRWCGFRHGIADMHWCKGQEEPAATHDVLLPPKAPSICAQTLQTALELTGGDRAKTHGDKKQNHQNIADLWNAYFSRNSAAPDGATEWRSPIIFSAHDVAVMMCLLKIARLKSGTHNPDNYVDLAGYAGIAAECADGQ